MFKRAANKPKQSPEDQGKELLPIGHMEPNRLGVKTTRDLENVKGMIIENVS